MKVVLAALNAKYVHSNLAVYALKAYAREHLQQKNKDMPELVIKEYTINHNLDLILQSLYQEKAAVVAFSCYIWNIHEILSVAKELHKVAPETRIWLGGPEVSYDSRKVLEENAFVEGVMRGEGEETFYELVKCWSGLEIWADSKSDLGYAMEERKETAEQDKNASEFQKNPYRNILGITYRSKNGEILENLLRPLMALDCVPFVYQDLERFQNKILYYETSRGCPFSCSYCLSSIDKSVRFRSMELVEKELQFFLDNQVPQVKFIDRTFNCKKEHALAIWSYITEHDNGVTNFHFEVSADLIGEKELALFQRMRPGLIQLEIGLQSTHPETIKEIRRSMNIERLKENMLTIRGFGNIHQHLDLIAGLPYEDFATFQQSFNDAYAMQPDQLQLGFLKVLKGSYMGEQIVEYDLQYQDSQPYEVLSTKWISYDEILQLKLVEEMVEVYYNSDQFEHVLSYLVPFFVSPYAFYEALGNYYKNHNLFGIGYKREARYEVLRAFCDEWFADSMECCQKVQLVAQKNHTDCESENMHFSMKIFTGLLTYDYYLRENAKSRPSWAKEEPIDKSEYHAFFKNGGTDEICLQREGYDSRVAARMMHMEPVVREALPWLTDDTSCKTVIYNESEVVYCLFDYENRNPLSKDANVVILSHL